METSLTDCKYSNSISLSSDRGFYIVLSLGVCIVNPRSAEERRKKKKEKKENLSETKINNSVI